MARHDIRTVAESIRRSLASVHRGEVGVLGVNLDDSETILTLSTAVPPGLRPGSILSIGMETMRVADVDANTGEVEVIRSWAQTVAASAHLTGEEIWINPRFTGTDIVEAMYDELESWSPDLYRVSDATVSIAEDAEVYELSADWADALGVVSVRRNWTVDASQAWPSFNYRLQAGSVSGWAQTTTSGKLLRFLEPTYSGRLHIVVGRPFDTEPWELTTNLITDVGMERSQVDVLKFGVRYRLLGDKEAGRSSREAQDEPRRAEEVPPRSAADEANRLYAMYIRRKNVEIAKLRKKYPLRIA